MLLEYEQRDPLELDTQIGLSKSVTVLMEWGHDEYAQELADRSIKLADLNPAYPTVLGTSATVLTSVGLHELAIEYADMAIATEATTQPWSKAWYAKGRALIELDRDDEAIVALTTVTKNNPELKVLFCLTNCWLSCTSSSETMSDTNSTRNSVAAELLSLSKQGDLT